MSCICAARRTNRNFLLTCVVLPRSAKCPCGRASRFMAFVSSTRLTVRSHNRQTKYHTRKIERANHPPKQAALQLSCKSSVSHSSVCNKQQTSKSVRPRSVGGLQFLRSVFLSFSIHLLLGEILGTRMDGRPPLCDDWVPREGSSLASASRNSTLQGANTALQKP